MDLRVVTGHTKSASGQSLIVDQLKTAQGEHVVMLLQVFGSSSDVKIMEKEYKAIVEHSLLETEGDAGSRLDSVLKELNGLIKGFLVSKSIDDFHGILGIVAKDGTVYVSHAGRAEAYIVRAGSTSQITEYTKGKPTPAFVHIASGPIEPRDTLICSTQRLLRTVTPAQLAQHAQRGDQLLDELRLELEAEKEKAALAVMLVGGKGAPSRKAAPTRSRSGNRRRSSGSPAGKARAALGSAFSVVTGMGSSLSMPSWLGGLREVPANLLDDLRHPDRKKKAHLFILAGVMAVFLVVWAGTNLMTSSQHNQSKAELKATIEEITSEIRTAENRYLTGDMDAANAILTRAEDKAKDVMNNDSRLYREEALGLLEQVRTKREEINNIVRMAPRTVASIEAKNSNVQAQGMIGVSDGEIVAYDKQNLYRIILNSIDEPSELSEEDIIVHGAYFDRMKTLLFQMKDAGVIELINNIPTSMKTEDPAGWIAATTLETYLRFLYVLSEANNQIYKYERLSNRYSAPAEYNVNGDLEGSLDMAIDGNIYILKEGGDVIKLLRGEVRPFAIRHLPEGALSTATKVFKVFDGNLYFLDPEGSRVIVVTDGGSTGEAAYVKQYILEGEQIGTLQDLYIDPEELRIYVLDEKRLYAIDIEGR